MLQPPGLCHRRYPVLGPISTQEVILRYEEVVTGAHVTESWAWRPSGSITTVKAEIERLKAAGQAGLYGYGCRLYAFSLLLHRQRHVPASILTVQ